MKLIKTYPRFRARLLATLPNIDIYFSIFIQACGIGCVAALIWFAGPQLTWHHTTPLASADKRLYLITYLLLVWLLKLLMIDFDVSNFFHHKDPETQKKLFALKSRFHGVMQFLTQTSTNKFGHRTRLRQLPWYLLIGTPNTGKTSLLANSNVHFILQRQLPSSSPATASDTCDWWITRDVSIIDVPGKYLDDKSSMYAVLWQSFLRLVKKYRHKNTLNGIIITLALPEIMKLGDPKRYQIQLKSLLQRIQQIQTVFAESVPCYLVITKCDLLTGFTEFFAESTDEEVAQAWGLTLPPSKPGDKVHDLFAAQFNTLIKKLNQQLLWRLHQERNPMARPLIKDFPLQVERLKEFTLDFIKKLLELPTSPTLKGIYFTSAQQEASETEAEVIEAINTTQRAIQLFKTPRSASRTYFITQLITHGLTNHKNTPYTMHKPTAWKHRFTYAASLSLVTLAALLFGKDFEQGVKQAYAIQNTLTNYHLAIQQPQDADEHLEKTLTLLNTLQQTAQNPGYKLDKLHILTFYSNKSTKKSNAVYQHALQNILIPELKNYFGEYLNTPINKNLDYVYAALKAYLMFGDPTHYQPDYITNTLLAILPNRFTPNTTAELIHHVNIALSTNRTPLSIDNKLIQETRTYLTALPSFRLSYVILKNINNNNLDSKLDLGINNNSSAPFVSKQIINTIPLMFTANAFSGIIDNQTLIAAQEAVLGNWILGSLPSPSNSQEATTPIWQQLRTTYINSYVETWETLLTNIHLAKVADLASLDNAITSIISNNSPLLQILHTLHDNTYFEPIMTSSPKLQTLGSLVDKNNPSDNTLYQIFSGLQTLHQHLHSVLTAENEHKAAFDAVSTRMQHIGDPDIITQLRLIADKSPEPIKAWLDKITDDAWRFLLQDATRYIDTSWQEQVHRIYQAEIANHYPFSANATQEVEISKFTDFFGNPGVMLSFYNNYLQPFIDTTTTDWRWKSIDNQKLPFTDTTLRQIQYAMRVHHMFFPNGDNKLNVQFALQSYDLGSDIKRIKLGINAKQITDRGNGAHNAHLLAWPNKHEAKLTTVQFTLQDQTTVIRDFPGEWGWFKLVNQSFVNSLSRKEILINLSTNHFPVKYRLFTQGSFNPFIATNLQHLQLPAQLIERDKSHA